jgi:hypothetical protein
MIAYRRDPQVIKMHIPMTHRFLPVWQTGPLVFDVPGIFRLAGLEVRRPAGGALRRRHRYRHPAVISGAGPSRLVQPLHFRRAAME